MENGNACGNTTESDIAKTPLALSSISRNKNMLTLMLPKSEPEGFDLDMEVKRLTVLATQTNVGFVTCYTSKTNVVEFIFTDTTDLDKFVLQIF